ncbi:MAG: MraY family glycosyltransferase [Planctomycetota bacterium]
MLAVTTPTNPAAADPSPGGPVPLIVDAMTLRNPPWGSGPLDIERVLSPYVFVFYAAFLLALLFTPLMRRVAIHFGIIDQPDRERKIHKSAVAYLGGLAVFVGWVGGMSMSRLTHIHDDPGVGPMHLIVPPAIIFGAVLVVVLGLWDDVFGLSPRTKIIGQVSAAIALILSGIGTTITRPIVDNLAARLDRFFDLTFATGTLEAVVFATSVALVIAIIVFCCNASNLMDGLDGLCGGVTAIIAFGFVIIAVRVALDGTPGTSDVQDNGIRVITALALLGAVLGFVPFNFNPASIFMGDAGSLLLGFLCGLMIVLLGEVELKWLLASSVMFALPVLDTALAFARRFVNKRPLFSADRGHFHHQLVARGLTVKQAVLTAYGLAIFFVVCGVLIVFMRTRFAVAFYMVLFGFLIVTAYKIGMIHERRSPDPHDEPIAPTGDAEPVNGSASASATALRAEGEVAR